MSFVTGGDRKPRQAGPKLADWAQDWPLIVGPVNRVIGKEIRSIEHLHWWSFLAAYYEIGDCLFAQVVSIRKKKRECRKLTKEEQRFYRDNRELVDLKIEESAWEREMLEAWT